MFRNPVHQDRGIDGSSDQVLRAGEGLVVASRLKNQSPGAVEQVLYGEPATDDHWASSTDPFTAFAQPKGTDSAMWVYETA
jgi:hypothetical protein